ncbi:MULTISPECIES: hypothetical protein [unclassified Mesorhizobium]|uniref:hypothetical protein n=1 Tax=unclassified Mesorhizobium TaxID=325217 RepID=UPI000FD4B0C9|nr:MULTISPECIES: hypothetical protein [unclassified Mesorhizobium]RUV97270.1 hypothetical protein EOA88_01640 [Mesorhizobium sp. M5C.F.Ca.IN.020.14.1.1]RUV30511.1 hypothetical protein EOA86_10755 [Mesorhizobium sp. M5C.F.Ca.IN.020.32.2.1]RWG50724.1 MAG: hypothetical protein EOQ62_03425 [Mesorhizobium sp.]RWH55695.1 MAG: hypothetical protein EOQ82_15040 [Mesorhizobium sp.]RWI70715.1 MAG: hypothetical protein EOR18_18360 [Mesorhizobium sp.]
MTTNNEGGPDNRRIVRVELEFEDLPEHSHLEIEAGDLDAILHATRGKPGFEKAHLFERDSEETLTGIGNRRAISILVHRCRHVTVQVRYDGDTKSREFSPAVTILRVLQWAVSKRGFNLDDNAAAKANLMLPGADQPLPKDAMLGVYVKHPGCSLTLDLTLKDFTNG